MPVYESPSVSLPVRTLPVGRLSDKRRKSACLPAAHLRKSVTGVCLSGRLRTSYLRKTVTHICVCLSPVFVRTLPVGPSVRHPHLVCLAIRRFVRPTAGRYLPTYPDLYCEQTPACCRLSTKVCVSYLCLPRPGLGLSIYLAIHESCNKREISYQL